MVADGIAGTTDADGLHHAGVSQLFAAQLSVKHLWRMEQTLQHGGNSRFMLRSGNRSMPHDVCMQHGRTLDLWPTVDVCNMVKH